MAWSSLLQLKERISRWTEVSVSYSAKFLSDCLESSLLEASCIYEEYVSFIWGITSLFAFMISNNISKITLMTSSFCRIRTVSPEFLTSIINTNWGILLKEKKIPTLKCQGDCQFHTCVIPIGLIIAQGRIFHNALFQILSRYI